MIPVGVAVWRWPCRMTWPPQRLASLALARPGAGCSVSLSMRRRSRAQQGGQGARVLPTSTPPRLRSRSKAAATSALEALAAATSETALPRYAAPSGRTPTVNSNPQIPLSRCPLLQNAKRRGCLCSALRPRQRCGEAAARASQRRRACPPMPNTHDLLAPGQVPARPLPAGGAKKLAGLVTEQS
jgi:hypothetical protein